ncbi:MAG: phytoene desaturase family protein [Planctomycetota bacterium]
MISASETSNGTSRDNARGGGHGRGLDRDGVVVVGGGLAGLAAAVEIARTGVRVVVVDPNPHVGGKMNVLEADGFKFDMGPTIITLPQVLKGIIERTGRDPADYIDLIDLDPQWRCFFDDGVTINLRRDPRVFARELDAQFPDVRPGDGFLRFYEFSRKMYRLSEKVFFYKDLGGIGDLLRKPPTDPGVGMDALGMRLHSTVGATIEKMIPEPHVRQVCEHFLQYVGSSPFLAPAVLSLIASAQLDHGCWYPMGGTRQVARSLERIAEELGVERVAGRRVSEILVEGDRTVGVRLDDGREIAADAVVSNCDVQRTNRDLLKGVPGASGELGRVGGSYQPACSGLVLYLGLRRQYEHLAHHNFLFSRDSRNEFADIYERGVPARDPTLYIAAPSRTDADQAPEGGEALYILIHTAALRDEHRWLERDGSPGPTLTEYRPVVLDKLKQHGMEDIEEHIAVERYLTPPQIDRMYNAEGGAIYGLASHGRLKGGFKPRNRSRVAKGLYLAGGSVNPGPGVPMVLMSGVTAAWAALEDAGIDHAAKEKTARAAEPAA